LYEKIMNLYDFRYFCLVFLPKYTNFAT